MAPIPLITGPTAVGKTGVAVEVAERLAAGGSIAELVSCDSRQVYRELNAGTAKPTADELARVPHHFIGCRSVADPWSAGRFAEAAEKVIADIHGRGRTALVVGGSTLYLRALLEGLSDIPPVPPEVRQRLNERLAREGPGVLYRELVQADPEFAASLDSTKSQRIVRGLEVFLGTGTPLSEFHRRRPEPAYRFRVIVLDRPRPDLYARIDERVPGMVRGGLVDELRALIDRGFDPESGPLRTIGYSEALRHLRGEIGLDRMIELIRRNTRRYAKRQMTWFRAIPDATWIDAASVDADALAARITLPDGDRNGV